MSVSAADVLRFWLEEAGPARWYEADPGFDAEIAERFGATWEAARDGALEFWHTDAPGTLAFLVVTDQFPRNMFRGDARAFATDPLALAAARTALERGFDLETPEPQRQFFYLPLMHSEDVADQDRCCALFAERMPGENERHARAHTEIIRRFGRFPYRNDALGRETTAQERAFLEGGGYAAILREIEE